MREHAEKQGSKSLLEKYNNMEQQNLFTQLEEVGSIGKKVLASDLIDIFSAYEGSINMYYGLIGNGKTMRPHRTFLTS